MKKRESTFKNMILVLFIVSATASAVLAFVYTLTEEPIKKSKIEKEKNAIKEVTGNFDNNPLNEILKITDDKGNETECYPARKNGKIFAYAVKSYSNKGFSGKILTMTGFDLSGKIIKTVVLEHHETPGLGDKIQRKKSDFALQFDNLNVKDIPDKDNDGILIEVKKDNGTIDAITAATISSRAFCDAEERAYKIFKKIKQENEQN